MKRIILITLMMAGLLTACKTSRQLSSQPVEKPQATMRQMPQGRLLHVEYDFQGMAFEQIRAIILDRTDGKPVIHFEYISDKRQYDVADSLFDQARAIIEEEQMYNYEPSYQWDTQEQVLDGYRWSFEAVFEGGQRIGSSGRNLSPDGKGLSRISTLLEQTARSLVRSEEGRE
ncbi:MAG: hypothetical protein K5683_10800 [Prevotella sp.]|nr:hypothetical protein [Prevotella sp.]